MSLLIDALKQAEAARSQNQGDPAASTAPGMELEPLPEAKASHEASANKPYDAPMPAPTRQSRTSRSTSQASTTATAATRELFEVKQQGPNRLPLILAAVAIVVLLLGAGYVWWAIQPRSSLIAPTASAANGTVNNAVTPPAAIPPQPMPSAPPENSAPQLVAETTTLPSSPTPAARSERRFTLRRATSSDSRTESVAPSEVRPARAAAQGGELSVIESAYSAYMEGNLPLARQRYQEVLRWDPRNVDAMNALGLIAWRSGQPDVAERMFRAAVNADPKDATAVSQLAMLYAESDASFAEARLRNLIASQPNAAAAHYALGSLLARQGRWNDAQQALFQAYTLDSDNPDVLFNLAVSLEHLGQTQVARQFYERALQALNKRPGSFDRNAAQSRFQTLGSR